MTFEILAVTDRRLCGENFLDRLALLAASGIDGLVLREKDLSPPAYEELARKVSPLCRRGGADFIPHGPGGAAAARALSARRLHLPLPFFEGGKIREDLRGLRIGVSVHSLEEARRAAGAGADYLIAGHIFRTRSKEGLPGRGLPFLEEICRDLSVPVYAIGGITGENIRQVREAGAAGVCILSPFMLESGPAALTWLLRRAAELGGSGEARSPGGARTSERRGGQNYGHYAPVSARKRAPPS